jgi:aminoglycoside 3-N-acetyltransferase
MNHEVVRKLADDWRAVGVAEGDTLLVHSSLSRTLQRTVKMGGEGNPGLVIRSFLEALGKTGTLLLPLFNFDFAKGVAFDIRHSPSQMGALTEAGRLWPCAVRTGHPIYSFAVIGREADRFRGLRNFSGYGQDSPFGILHRLGGKIAVIDLPDQNSMTFYHYIEEALEVPYRYHKNFTGRYVDAAGMESTETFGLFVRDLNKGVLTHVDPMGEILWEKRLYTGFRPHEGCGLRLISTLDMFDEVAMVIKKGKAEGLLYEIQRDIP